MGKLEPFETGLKSQGPVPGPSFTRKAEPLPTVTDANLYLGRILPDHFLGGQMSLYPELAEEAIRNLGHQLNLDPNETALGIIEIANAHMERALRVISVERGHDPRDFTLLSFGGAWRPACNRTCPTAKDLTCIDTTFCIYAFCLWHADSQRSQGLFPNCYAIWEHTPD